MIKLEVKDYCQNCPGFEPSVTRNELYDNAHGGMETIIRCKYRGRCESMVRYLKKESNENVELS